MFFYAWQNFLWFLSALASTATEIKHESEQNLKAPSNYRLSKSVLPQAYDIQLLDVNLQNFTFSGVEEIDAKVVWCTNVIQLHVRDLNVSVVSLKYTNNRWIKVKGSKYDQKNEIWSIILNEYLWPFNNIRITLNFSGTLRDDMVGFYRSFYVDEKNKTRWLAATQFQLIDARSAFPCFDEPSLKSTFKLGIQPPAGHSCLSNMPLAEAPSWRANDVGHFCEFEKSPRMSSYLLAYVVSDFAYAENASAKLRVWTRPQALPLAGFALGLAPAVLDYLGWLFGQRYHLPKMDMVALPDILPGAMENWGLITFDEWALLHDEANASRQDRQRVAQFITHEIVHQWFGNLVTPDWWGYVWLSEGFAQYFEYTVVDQFETDWRMDQLFVVQQVQSALRVDSQADSKALSRTVSTRSEIEDAADDISYSKGASIVRMLELTVGTDTFFLALRDYLKDRMFKSAVPGDLWRSFRKHVNLMKVPIVRFMNSWSEQPGYPCVTVSVESNYIRLSQERFLLPQKNGVKKDSVWWVPITFTSMKQLNASSVGPSTKPVYWLHTRRAIVPRRSDLSDVLLFNVHAAGFYRVNYDKSTWIRIIEILNRDQFELIPVLNRAAIIDDLLNLAMAGMVNYNIAFKGLNYLKRETNYLPFKSAIESLNYFHRRFDGTENVNIFRDYLKSLFSGIYKKLSYDDKPGDDHLTILLRRLVSTVVCQIQDSDCIAKSINYFSKWRTTGQSIPKNQRATAYCFAIKYGNASDWEYLWRQFEISNLASEKNTILEALGCSDDPEIHEKYLLKTLLTAQESGIRKPNLMFVYRGMTSSLKSAKSVLKFVEKHHTDILKNGSSDKIVELISQALPHYATEELSRKLENMIIRKAGLFVDPVLSDLKAILEKTEFELELFKRYENKIIESIKMNKL